MTGLALAELLQSVSEEQALEVCLAILKSHGFGVTSWREGDDARTLVQLQAKLDADRSQAIPKIAAMGLNGLATDAGLDLLSESHYQNFRVAAVSTAGKFRFTASATAPPATINASDLVIANTPTQQPDTVTFRNTTGDTLNPGSFVDLDVAAEVAGAASNLSNNTTLYLWTPLVGVTVTNPPDPSTGTWIATVGIDKESDARLTARNSARWGALSYGAPDGAYKKWALEADSSVTRVLVRSNNPFGPGTVDIVCATSVGGISDVQAAAIRDYILGVDPAALLVSPNGIGRRPLNDVVSVNSAFVSGLSIIGTARVKSAFQATTTAARIQQEIDTYFGELEIGGDIIPPATSGVAVFSELVRRVKSLDGMLQLNLTFPTADIALSETVIVAGIDYSQLVVAYV